MHECNKEDEITQIMIDVACIKQAILGNGQPGLCKRVDDLENNYSNGIKLFTTLGLVVGAFVSYITSIFKA